MCDRSNSLPLAIISILLLASTGFGQCELGSMLASDALSGDRFGAAVAADGDFVVVGAAGTNSDSREFVPSYIFQKDNDSWVEHSILTPNDISPRAQFGRSVAIRGDLVAVGAPVDGHSIPFQYDGHGSVYLYRYDGLTWNQEAKLIARYPIPAARFGLTIAIGETEVFVGASGEDNERGAVYVFSLGDNGWVQSARLVDSRTIAKDRFGWSLALDEPWLVVSAPNTGHTNGSGGGGSAYTFRRHGSTWVEDAELSALSLNEYAWFGVSIAVSGTVIAVGASGFDGLGFNSGAVFTFRLLATGWEREDILVGSDTDWRDYFGTAVSVDGDLVLVGAPYAKDGVGGVYIFLSSTNGDARREVATLRPHHRSWFGNSLATIGKVVVVGASLAYHSERFELGSRPGRAYYHRIRPDAGEPDCNVNNVNDACETDCNGNQNPDGCDVYLGSSDDCNLNDIPDECEVDCNDNTFPDECDIALGTSQDCQPNGVPDECELVGNDCNGNGVPDYCDIATRTSNDCNENVVPDECEIDCNENEQQDSCDIDLGFSVDCNGNDIPDECEPFNDCNTNGVQDLCDIALSTSQDGNRNSIPDECEVSPDLYFSVPMPGLIGFYGGFTGVGHSGSFDFEQSFVDVWAAWLVIENDEDECSYPYDCFVLHVYTRVDGVSHPEVRVPNTSFKATVPIAVPDTILDGTGRVGVSILPGACCDRGAVLTGATLWFEAIPVPKSLDLFDFWKLQTCFGPITSGQSCEVSDFDRNGLVNQRDYSIFVAALEGPPG